MSRKFTKYPSTKVLASAKRKYEPNFTSPKMPTPKYATVGDLKRELAKFSDECPISVIGEYGWGINPPDYDLCFIKEISDSGDSCDIYLV